MLREVSATLAECIERRRDGKAAGEPYVKISRVEDNEDNEDNR